MNGKTKTKIDFSIYSDNDLEEMFPAIQRELEKRRAQKKQAALDKIKEIAGSVGMTPEELLGLAGESRRKQSRRGPIAWQHPDDPSLVYRGGKKPDWLKDLQEEGREPVKVVRWSVGE